MAHVIVRQDLPVGLQVANTIHAVGETTFVLHPPGSIAVGLHARDEAHLHSIAKSLTEAGVPHQVIIESEGPYAGQAMAIGVLPVFLSARNRVRKVLSHLPLVR